MRSEWDITVVADKNHLTVDIMGTERIGGARLMYGKMPKVDMICDPNEDPRQLLKDALVALVEHL